ncbi:leucine-rich repeat-containing protein 1 [Aedes albopictus]|uniref:Cpij004912 membrane glycoprotein lig-1 n=1 Tax=Aedes albopictus TaxID=7160 RepID=A0ABM1ZG12_AEDAL|nr:leucine-rich repeat-containing protein 1-like [Aedes albopictus]
MKRTEQKLIHIAIVVLCALSPTQPASSIQLYCNNYSEYCTINGVTINSETSDFPKFPVRAKINLVNANIDYISPEILQGMKWVSQLTIANGKVKKIFLKHDLQELVATGSETYDVIIDDVANEDLEQLSITQNRLDKIPENVGNLKALTVLTLNNNNIEVLDLGELQGLDKLKTVDLSNNKIYYMIPIDSFELSRLEIFKLNNNFLTEIDFDAWNVPRLTTLFISSNSLKYIKDFNEESFPSLKSYQDDSNLFDCRWRAGFISMLKTWTSLKNQYHYSTTCQKSVQLSSAVYRMLNINDIRNDTIDFDDKQELQNQLNSMLDTEKKHSRHIESLTKLLREQTEQFKVVSGKLQAQQTTIDGLLAQIDDLQQRVEEMKQMMPPAGRAVPKGLRERMIQDIAEVIRRNLVEIED